MSGYKDYLLTGAMTMALVFILRQKVFTLKAANGSTSGSNGY